MTAGLAIQDLLKRTGMPKKALCEAAGISRSSLDAYLKGERQPSVAQLERLGEAVGLRVDIVWRESFDARVDPPWLISDNPEMRPAPTTMEERGELLVRVIPLARALRRTPPGELEFPPFRSLRQPASS